MNYANREVNNDKKAEDTKKNRHGPPNGRKAVKGNSKWQDKMQRANVLREFESFVKARKYTGVK